MTRLFDRRDETGLTTRKGVVRKTPERNSPMSHRLFFVVLVLLVACEDSLVRETPEHPVSVSAVVVATEGGTLSLPDGARVTIPPGALTRDAELTFTRVACGRTLLAAEFASCAYEVTSADGGSLVGRYDLTIPGRDPAAAPSCVFSMTEDGWRCQAEGETATGSGTTSASRFSTFVLHSQLPQTAPMNLMADLDFELCGGDLFGEWEFVLYVGPEAALNGRLSPVRNPEFDVCEPFAYYAGLIAQKTETLTITPAAPEAAWDVEYFYQGHLEGYELHAWTDACLTAAGAECPLQTPWCMREQSLCVCRLPYEQVGDGGTYLYEVEGGYSFTEGGPPAHLCVIGDFLFRHMLWAGPGSDAVWVYQRK